jgi:ABC-type Fe3+ transport system substrate-binding protein
MTRNIIGRRPLLKATGAALLASPFIAPSARAATTVTVLGSPGIHQVLWRKYAEMIAHDTNGAIELQYNPLGYTAAFSKLQTEQAARRISSDLFYGNAPFPEQAALAGLTEGVPFDQLPHTMELYPAARKSYGLEMFHFAWGIVGFNTNQVKPDAFGATVGLDEFTDPRWKGKLGWVDPRTFPYWLPLAVTALGEDKWLDWARAVDRNVVTYYNGWVDNRIALQRGDIALAFHNVSSVYTSAEVDKAAVQGRAITSPKPSWAPMPVCVSLTKGTPRKEAALQVVNLIASAPYQQQLMEVGVNPSNHPANYPSPIASKMLSLIGGAQAGLKTWSDTDQYMLPIDWLKWAAELKRYNATWETEILRKRT